MKVWESEKAPKGIYKAGFDPCEPDKVFKNQDSREVGPGFSKEFYDELHRFYSQGNRRSGRTYLLARVLVNTAIETGEQINLIDHHAVFKNSIDTQSNFKRQVDRVLYEYESKGLYLDYKFNNGGFTVKLTGNIYEATRVYNMIKNDYTPLVNKEYPMTPDEAFGTRNLKLLLI